MRLGRFTVRFFYPRSCNVLLLNAEFTPYLTRELAQFGTCNYLPSSRIVIMRPRFLFWLVIYLMRTSRFAANLAAFLKSSQIPVLVTMDSLDSQIPTMNHKVSLLEEASKLVPQTDFISIQHGQELRRFSQEGDSKLKRVTLLCFGQWAAENFPKFGRRENKYIPVGALINSLYLRARPADIEKSCELTVISTIKDEEWWGSIIGERRAGYERLVSFVRQFCIDRMITPLVALTIDRDSNQVLDESIIERQWFIERLGPQLRFTEPSLIFGGLSGLDERGIVPKSPKERFSTYFASDSSVVTIGMSSTALWESFSRGNRILAVNLTNNPIYDFPIEGIWSMRQPTYEDFESRLTTIIQMQDAEWESASRGFREFLITSDATESVTERIRLHVGSAIEESPWKKKLCINSRGTACV
ncbi:MAG: hypothetical protein EBW79_07245 [Actinobacteria bacterium]|nr:hypothetical protein [Actinomycetota bacterium]